MQEIYDTIVSTVDGYIDEMIAQGAWMGHAYASEYLKSYRESCLSIFQALKETVLYKDPQMNVLIDNGLFVLYDDIDSYITSIYQAGLDSTVKERVSEIIDNKFLDNLGSAIGLLVNIYETQTGHKIMSYSE